MIPVENLFVIQIPASQFSVENYNQISCIVYKRQIAGGYRNSPHSNHGYYSVVFTSFLHNYPCIGS